MRASRKKILLTCDKDFLNNKIYPSVKHPGVIVLPQQRQYFFRALYDAMSCFRKFSGCWQDSKIELTGSGEIRIFEGGKLRRYKLDQHGRVFEYLSN